MMYNNWAIASIQPGACEVQTFHAVSLSCDINTGKNQSDCTNCLKCLRICNHTTLHIHSFWCQSTLPCAECLPGDVLTLRGLTDDAATCGLLLPMDERLLAAFVVCFRDGAIILPPPFAFLLICIIFPGVLEGDDFCGDVITDDEDDFWGVSGSGAKLGLSGCVGFEWWPCLNCSSWAICLFT